MTGSCFGFSPATGTEEAASEELYAVDRFLRHPCNYSRHDQNPALAPTAAELFLRRFMSHSRQPWSMKWIALIIVLIIGPYTFLRWHYRKPQEAFEPYHDIKDRANTMRLVSAGFQRVTLATERPADGSKITSTAPTESAAGGLPSALSTTLVDKPVLTAEVLSVSAPAETNTLFAYSFEFTCRLPDIRHQVDNVYLYSREGRIFIVPEIQQLAGELLERNRENRIRATVPAGVLKPGTYEVTLIGERSSRSWSLEVK
jgi:hypothetical protein